MGMLVIRDEQMQAFAQNAKRQFESEMVRHISGFAPGRFEALGEKAVREMVSLGIERAEKYGFSNRGPARFYIELMFLLGSDFDTDPQYAWAAEVLGGPDPADQMTRADQLHQKTLSYIETAAGQYTEYERQAFDKIAGASSLTSTVSPENIPVNPCSAEDARTPVGHTTVSGPEKDASGKT
jgi:hypothetical protein